MSNRNGAVFNIYQRLSNGTGQDELLLQSKELKSPSDWSRNGRFLIYQSPGGIWALPLTGDKKPVPLVRSEFNNGYSQLSPDGKWLAYFSNESSRPEVYVIPFAPGFDKPVTGKWQISTAGGSQPRWRGDGKELFYVAADGRLMAAEVKSTGTTFDRGAPQALFDLHDVRTPGNNVWRYVASADGKRFLVTTSPGVGVEQSPLTVVVNWLASKKK
jgi:Tol biopolymer transport system component